MSKHRLNPTPVRIPPDLRAWLEQQAANNHRSLNGEIVAILSAHHQQHGPAPKAGKGGRQHA